jgi:hypothetical protein
MATITLTFDSIEEQDDARTALDGYKWKLAMWDLDQKLRSIVKYNSSLVTHNEPSTNAEIEVADKLREEIRSILNGYNINLED